MTRPAQMLLSALERARSGPGWGLTRIPGAARAHVWLSSGLAQIQRRIGHAGEIEAFGFTLAVDPSDRQVAAEVLRTGTYEPVETRLFASTIQSEMTVVDIGANIGIYTLLAAKGVGPAGRVVAFEPAPDTAALLRRNVELNGFANVTVEEAAVAAASGPVELFTVEGHPGLASLDSGNARRSSNKIRVPAFCLDEYFGDSRVDVIKIDAQGAEAEIAAGAQRILERDRPVVFAELWPAGLRNMGSNEAAFLRMFTQVGYSIATTDAPHRELAVVDAVAAARPTGSCDLLLRPTAAS